MSGIGEIDAAFVKRQQPVKFAIKMKEKLKRNQRHLQQILERLHVRIINRKWYSILNRSLFCTSVYRMNHYRILYPCCQMVGGQIKCIHGYNLVIPNFEALLSDRLLI